MDKPHRAYQLTISIGGDTWEDVMRELEHFHLELESHGAECGLVAGGSSSSGYIHIVHDPDMTHDRWCEALRVYVKASREAAASEAMEVARWS